jgi:hypothetical protein
MKLLRPIQTKENTPMKSNYKRNLIAATLATAVFAGWATNPASAQSTGAIPSSLVTPDKVETRIGTLEFKDGAPTVETAEKVRDALNFTRALNAYNNSFRGVGSSHRKRVPEHRG